MAHWEDILFDCTLYDKSNSITDTEVFKTFISRREEQLFFCILCIYNAGFHPVHPKCRFASCVSRI